MNKLSSLMQKEMTRKEFLATLGLGAATIFGFGSLIRMLSPDEPQRNALSYGGGAYGGRKSGA